MKTQSDLQSYEDHVGLWRDELQPWMPDVLFDAHVHLWPKESMGPFAPGRLLEPLSTFTHFTWEEAVTFYEGLYSGKTIAGLIAFGIPLREANLELTNEYIARLMKQDARIHGFIISDPKDTKRTIRQFDSARKEGVRFCGVKPHYDLLRKDIPRSVYKTTMDEFLPHDLLEFMDSERLVMMLHTSSYGMGDPDCQKFTRSVVERYPHIKIIMAHMGRYLEKEQFFAFFESGLLDSPAIFLEMSSASQPDVYKKVFSRRDLWSRLIFGSDVPFGLITGNEYTDPENGPTFITRDLYSWTDPTVHERFRKQRAALTYNTYHTIHAVKTAMDALHLNKQEESQLKADVFCSNSQRLLKGDLL